MPAPWLAVGAGRYNLKVIEAADLVKTFKDRKRGRVRAVDGVSFSVRAGEIVALLGPNGAGKTTTLRMIAGLLAPEGGSVQVEGKPPSQAKDRIGFLPADTGLYHRLTPREVLGIFGILSGLSRQEIARRMESLARDLDMGDFLDTRIGRLSTGMRQRVAVARCMIHQPDVLVMDEPARGLDVESSRTVENMILASRERSRAVLVSTHIMEEAEYLADRILVMNRGKLVAEGTIEDLRAKTGRTKLREIYLSLVEGT